MGHAKKLKCIVWRRIGFKNLTFNFFLEQIIEWKVACSCNDDKKRGYMPHDRIELCPKIAWTGDVGDYDLVIFLGTKSNSFSLQKPITVGDSL